MKTILFLIQCILILQGTYCVKRDLAVQKKSFIYNTYEYDTRYNVIVNNETEQILDFVEANDDWAGYPTRIHVSTNDSVSADYPVFITATQQKGVSSWELPLIIQTKQHSLLFNDLARTLCPHDAGPDIKIENRPTIHLATENHNNISLDIKLRRVKDFYIELNKELSLNVTPTSPKYYYFSFEQNPWNITQQYSDGLNIFNYTIPKSVILIIESFDDLCAIVSIQNNSCPVFDNEKDVKYQGYHLTMTNKGGITLTQSMFPNGFYVVFIVKENDDECTGASDTDGLQYGGKNRLKEFRFSIIATVSYREYIVGAVVVAAVVSLVAAFVVLAGITGHRLTKIEVPLEEEPVPSTSRDDATAPIINDTEMSWSNPLTVGKLSQAPPDTMARRSERYFWGALTVAVVYSLPVIQLLYAYQRMVVQTGDQDLCYYNFLCAHPLWGMSDFNHVYSNVGYVLLAAVYLGQVRRRQITRQETGGIPQHYGLLYSMGLALAMEGFLSACYHLCPNKMNFQFDSSFMYVIAVLVMIKLYQNRHSDLIPSAHSTFMLIALIMSVGVIGILFPSTYFSVFFTILHLFTCFVLTLKIYYAGRFKMEWSCIRSSLTSVQTLGVVALRPTHTARAALLALANIANWSFAVYCAYNQNRDLARQLLAILMGNAVLYTIFYVCMKLIHREKLPAHAWTYCVLANVAWALGLYLFIHGNTKWSETPAMSRRRNAMCTSLRVFDSHDAWHVTSAAAMFLTFNMLLTVDDALVNTPRDLIATF